MPQSTAATPDPAETDVATTPAGNKSFTVAVNPEELDPLFPMVNV